jgi:hypothetical protein
MSSIAITIKAEVPLPAKGGAKTARLVMDTLHAAKAAGDALAKATGADVAVATYMPTGASAARRVAPIKVAPVAPRVRRGRPRGSGGRTTKEED